MTSTIPAGSLVLVTGVNSYLGSHVADQFLLAGYRVRGTARGESKVRILKERWDTLYPGKFELALVPDMAVRGAFDEAVKNTSGVVHVASNVSLDPDPTRVIPEVVNGVQSILASAAATPTVKRFVYTSSSTAATSPKPKQRITLDETTWNDEDVATAQAPPPYTPDRKWSVYSASKTLAERAVWNFVKTKNPGFIVNTVLPNANFGVVLSSDHWAMTPGWIKQVFKGELDEVLDIPPQWFVDVQDTGRLHVAALINPEVKNERIYAYAEPFNWNDVIRVLKKLRPDQQSIPNGDVMDDDMRDLSNVSNQRAEELLKSMGRSGWTSLEESINNTIKSL